MTLPPASMQPHCNTRKRRVSDNRESRTTGSFPVFGRPALRCAVLDATPPRCQPSRTRSYAARHQRCPDATYIFNAPVARGQDSISNSLILAQRPHSCPHWHAPAQRRLKPSRSRAPCPVAQGSHKCRRAGQPWCSRRHAVHEVRWPCAVGTASRTHARDAGARAVQGPCPVLLLRRWIAQAAAQQSSGLDLWPSIPMTYLALPRSTCARAGDAECS